MQDLVTIAGGSGAVTMLVTVIINIIKIGRESRRQEAIITRKLTNTHIRAMDAAAKRGSQHIITIIMSSLGRFMLLSTALCVLTFLTIYSTKYPSTTIFVPENAPYTLRILSITLFELDLGTTWGEFQGVVVFPVWFAIIGGAMGYFFGQAPFDKR